MGSRRTRARKRVPSMPASSGWARTAISIERAQLSRSGSPRIPCRRQCGRDRVGRAARSPSGASRRRDGHGAGARDRGDTSPGVQHARRRARAAATGSRTACRRIEQSIALAEQHDLAAGGLPRLRQPRRAVQLARPARAASRLACAGSRPRRRSATWRSSPGSTPTSRVSYCALTDRCEAEGIEAAQTAIDLDRRLGLLDHLAVPADRARPDPPVPRRVREGARLLPGSVGAGRGVGEPQLLFPVLRRTGDAPSRCRRTGAGGALLREGRRKSAERAGVEPEALMLLPFSPDLCVWGRRLRMTLPPRCVPRVVQARQRPGSPFPPSTARAPSRCRTIAARARCSWRSSSGCGARSAAARSPARRHGGGLKNRACETLGVVATPPENARLYFKFRPKPAAHGAPIRDCDPSRLWRAQARGRRRS